MPIHMLIKRLFRIAGLDLTLYNPERSDTARMARLLEHYEIDCVLDVGANVGQYARDLRHSGYTGRIVSFEPQSAAHRELMAVSAGDGHWLVPPPMAIGDEDGEIEINLARNSLSSSIRGMAASHESAAPESIYSGKEKVALKRLDAVFDEAVGDSARVLLKIDTQGYEAQVLEGAAKSLKRVVGVQLELSLVELYVGQQLFFELAKQLTEQGFAMVGLLPGFVDRRSGHLLQADGLFFRPELLQESTK